MSPILTTLLTTLIIAIASVGALTALVRWARGHSSDLRSASGFIEEFYKATQKLIKDDSTPESVLDFLEFMAARVGRPKMARSFALHLLAGLVGLQKEPVSERSRRFQRDLETLTLPQRELFAQAVMAGIISCAAADPLFSGIYRNTLMVFLSKSGQKGDATSPERANTLAVDLATHAHDCGLQAA